MNPYRRLEEKRRPVASRAARRTEAQAPVRRRAVRKISRFRDRQDESLYEGDGTFNPPSYEHKTSRIARAVNAKRKMFNGAGQINAISKKDALTQIHHLLNNVTKQHSRRVSFYEPEQEVGMSKEARRDVLAQALRSDEGFHMVGQELALPIKAILDYEGFVRKIYRVRKLAQSELFRIPVDIRSTAWLIGQDGKTPESAIKTKYINPTEFKIASFPTVDILDILHMNFDVLDRAQDTARQEIELQEDKAGIALLDLAAQTENAVTTFATLGIGAFEAVRYQVERHRLMVENFMINRQELSDIVTTMSAAVDPVTERELILAGYIGNILNSQILTAAGTGVEEVIPAGTFYAVTGADYLGEMGIRQELFSEPYNKFSHQQTKKGWAFLEICGFAIANSRSVAKGVK